MTHKSPRDVHPQRRTHGAQNPHRRPMRPCAHAPIPPRQLGQPAAPPCPLPPGVAGAGGLPPLHMGVGHQRAWCPTPPLWSACRCRARAAAPASTGTRRRRRRTCTPWLQTRPAASWRSCPRRSCQRRETLRELQPLPVALACVPSADDGGGVVLHGGGCGAVGGVCAVFGGLVMCCARGEASVGGPTHTSMWGRVSFICCKTKEHAPPRVHGRRLAPCRHRPRPPAQPRPCHRAQLQGQQGGVLHHAHPEFESLLLAVTAEIS